MRLNELLQVSFYNLLLYDLDLGIFVEYSNKYDDYYVAQVFADEIQGQLRTCIDVTKDKF